MDTRDLLAPILREDTANQTTCYDELEYKDTEGGNPKTSTITYSSNQVVVWAFGKFKADSGLWRLIASIVRTDLDSKN